MGWERADVKSSDLDRFGEDLCPALRKQWEDLTLVETMPRAPCPLCGVCVVSYRTAGRGLGWQMSALAVLCCALHLLQAAYPRVCCSLSEMLLLQLLLQHGLAIRHHLGWG